MNYIKKKKEFLFLALLVFFTLSVPKLSQLGFVSSEYLSEQPLLNYILATILLMAGFIISYFQITKTKKLNVNRAIRAYLSFGLGMSGVYYIVYATHLGCFSMPPDIAEKASIIDFVYFSFVTISTVGYGDIVPRHTFVRALVLFQVLFAIILILSVSKFNPDTN